MDAKRRMDPDRRTDPEQRMENPTDDPTAVASLYPDRRALVIAVHVQVYKGTIVPPFNWTPTAPLRGSMTMVPIWLPFRRTFPSSW